MEDRSALNVVLGRLLVVGHLLACGCEAGAAELGAALPTVALRLPAGSFRLGAGNGGRTATPQGQPGPAARVPGAAAPQPAAVPPKISRCWGGGMPSFSSTLSLMRAIVSSLSMSISISLPVSVLTLICHRRRHRSAHEPMAPHLNTSARLALRRGTHVHGSNRWLDGLRRFSVSEPAQARRTCQAAGSFSELWPPRGAWVRDGRAPRPRAQRLVARVWPPWPPDGAQAAPVREREGAEAPAREPRQQRRQRLRGWVSGWGKKKNHPNSTRVKLLVLNITPTHVSASASVYR